MGIKINFDVMGNPEKPTIILSKPNGDKLGKINSKSIKTADTMKNAPEIQFSVNKFSDSKKEPLWDEICDFRLIWCKEWDTWFQIKIDTDESTETVKSVSCVRLGEAELSQIMLYNIEINTEADIEREEYDKDHPTILYDPERPESSLLNRITEKAPHYRIAHVEATVASEQRIFSFDGKSIVDAFKEIEEEIGCLIVLPSQSDENGKIDRAIYVYDLESNCMNVVDGEPCGYRGEFTDKCPKCGSTNIISGYGKDTGIFITSDEIADNISFTTDTDSVKNCFKLEGGDELMTAAIRGCNPNGTDYIWHITEDTKKDMSDELRDKINSYDSLFQRYQQEISWLIPSAVTTSLRGRYNALIRKYSVYNEDLKTIPLSIKTYSSLMNYYYDSIDFGLYLQSGLMPSIEMSDTNATEQAALLTGSALSPVAVANIDSVSVSTADSAVLAMAKIIVKSTYQVKINTSSLSEDKTTWAGNFKITNYSDEENTAISETISVTVNGNYETFVKQKIEKALNKKDADDLSISGLFKSDMTLDAFKEEIQKYGLSSLTRIHDACQAGIDILIDQGVADKITWADKNPNLYDRLYTPYYNKLLAIEDEMNVRQNEIDTVVGKYDSEGILMQDGVQSYIEGLIDDVHDKLDFHKYLGDELWKEFCMFRREDKFSNSNYVSDGLNNAELIDRARQFIEEANKELYKSAELQHSISGTIKNILVMEKFKPLVKYFEVGNWIRVRIDDRIYKLRLLKYEIDFDNLNTLSSVEFSDVMKTADGLSDQQSIIEKATSMATSYDSVQRQASQGEKSNTILNNWVEKGLDATNTRIIGGADNQTQTWDEHGMLFRKYDPVTESYDNTQLKIINGTLAITDDNWQSVKTAVGKYLYFDPDSGELKERYGVNAEVLVGKLILGESLGIYNKSGSLTFRDEDGLRVNNDKNYFEVNPNSNILLKLSKTVDGTTENLLTVDENGKLAISGKFSASNGVNTFEVDPDNNEKLLKINNKTYGDVFYIDTFGKIHLWENYIALDANGLNFYNDDNVHIGKIGRNYIKNHENLYGLTYDIGYDSSFITWAYKTSNDVDSYLSKWAYYSKEIPYVDSDGNSRILSADTLHAGADIDMHNYKLKNVSWEDGRGVTGIIKFKQITSFDSNGLPKDCYDAEMEFKNGILIRGVWHSE